jgi:hypothetical protein
VRRSDSATGTDTARSEQAGEDGNEVDQKNGQMAHRRIVIRMRNPKESWTKQQFASHMPPQVLGYWTLWPSDLGFFSQRFSFACSQRRRSVPKPAKQNGGAFTTI